MEEKNNMDREFLEQTSDQIIELREDYVRKDKVGWSDVPFYQYMIVWCLSGFIWFVIFWVIIS